MGENNIEYNYISEKFWEPILSESLCFYYGAPNVSDYIDPLAFVQIDLNDFEKSFLIIKEAIENDLWSKRIDIIRKEKYKVLNYYNFFPTIERTITKDLWNNRLEKLRETTKIYILLTSDKINENVYVLHKNFIDLGFNIEIINNKDIIINMYYAHQMPQINIKLNVLLI